ncbi:class I SAM-dependent methyltransferase [Dethiothermospora halolimnae]|uniref:class I SAM-dependent methyltransferase n=1 Tax=Dethiothermospora halolimnae TaxID=3114390 RepID=UPI003CCB7892
MTYEKVKKELNETWDKVASNFGKIGPKYWNQFGSRLVELADIRKNGIVLDIGMGRGASLFPASKQVGDNGMIIGIDLSEGMVKETAKEIKEKNIKNAEVIKMDAGKLDFDDNYFDYVICGFGFPYLYIEDNKLSNISKILKKDGQVAFSVWGTQEDNSWISGLIGRHLDTKPKDNKDEKEKKEESDTPRLDTKEGIEEVLSKAGFKDIRLYEEDKDIIYKDKEEWWNEMWSNAVRRLFEKIDNDKLKELKEEALEELENYRNNKGICFKRKVLYCLARK